MNKIKPYLPTALRIIVAFLFLISAAAKLYPSPYFAISTFEVKQLYPMGFSEAVASYFSRTLIGIEFALGILLLQKNFLRTIVIPATFLMLLVFSIHLAIQTYVYGGGGNCGCFGELLPMTPPEAIAKNVVAMALLGWLYALLPKRGEKTDNAWVLSTTVLAFILMVFMMAPIKAQDAPIQTDIPVEVSTESETDTVPAAATVKDTVKETATVKKDTVRTAAEIVEPPKKHSGYAQYFPDIDKGKKTLCFFVPGCDHCREAAKELTEMKKRNKDFPKIEIIFMNEEADLIPEFFKEAGATYPYKIIDIIPFWKILGDGKDTPGVKYLWNGNEYVYYWGITDNKFNAAAYEKLVAKPYKELKK